MMNGTITTLGGEAAISSFRTTRQIYRDLMRLTRHAGNYNQNEAALQHTIRSQFKANMLETDETKIAQLKSQAIRALSNYYVYQAKLMVGNEQPKSIYEGDDEEDEASTRAAAFYRQQQLHKSHDAVPDAEVQGPARKRLSAADRRKNVLRTRKQIHDKQKRFADDFTSFAARHREALRQEQQQATSQEASPSASGEKESGGVV